MLTILEISTAIVTRISYSCMSFCCALSHKHRKSALLSSCRNADRVG